MSISSVNLLWQKRFRGLLPVRAHNLDDSGRALLIHPDPLEARTYQVLSVTPSGQSQELCAVSVETVHTFDAVPDGRLLLGVTNDNLYLFREGKKTRFMPDRRVAYSDVCLSPETGWFVCGFANAIQGAHAVAFGDANGRLGWMKDLRSAVNRVAISWDGRTVAVGTQEGQILALDNMRAPLWECVLEEPVTALAMPSAGPGCVAGTAAGTLLALDEEGGFRWRCPVGMPVLAVATDGQARWTAALLADGAAGLLTCLGPDGGPLWEYELEARPTGVCLSPSGKHLLVSAADGSVWLFDVDFTQAVGDPSARLPPQLAAARRAVEEGDLERACAGFSALLQAAPHEVAVAEEFEQARRQLVERRRAEAEAHSAEGRFRAALEALDAAFAHAPYDAELFTARVEARRRAAAECATRAEALEENRDWEAAGDAWLEALELDPANTAGRAALLRIRQAQAAALTSEGDRLRGTGDMAGAVERWQEAQRLHPTEELLQRLREAEVARCVATGIAHYEAQRMPEAAFQFKKALALDPGNDQAQRYLSYTQGMSAGSGIADRFARLE